jgi:hypothetical protein
MLWLVGFTIVGIVSFAFLSRFEWHLVALTGPWIIKPVPEPSVVPASLLQPAARPNAK